MDVRADTVTRFACHNAKPTAPIKSGTGEFESLNLLSSDSFRSAFDALACDAFHSGDGAVFITTPQKVRKLTLQRC